MNQDLSILKTEHDSDGNITFESYSDGFSTEREFDPNYKNGEIPSVVKEYENGKIIYWREYDNTIVDSWHNIDKRKEI